MTSTQLEWELNPELIGLLMAVSGENKDVGMNKTVFHFPSKDTSFARVVYTSRDKSEYYFIKQFDPRSERFKTKTPPAQLEHIYTEVFRKLGCSVPKSRVLGDHILLMEDCGTETLEDILRNKTAEQQEAIMAKLIPEQVKFAIAGRRIQIDEKDYDKIALYSNIERSFILNHAYWRPTAEKSEVHDFMDKTVFIRQQYPSQHFLGDNSTFHILFSNNAKWIDLEKIKFGHQSRELAGLYFSPETNLGFEAIERLIYNFKKAEYEAENESLGDNRKLDESEIKNYLRNFYKSGVIECYRRGTKIRGLETNNPEIYARFIDRHKGYADALTKYREKITAIAKKASLNGLYSSEEKEKFAIASNTILDLMSK